MGKTFAIDFDGTLVIGNNYPDIGEPNWPVVNKVKELKAQGHEIDLWTCRQGNSLQRAIDFCENILDLKFDHYNTTDFAVSRNYQPIKMVADYYIDDCALSVSEFLSKTTFDETGNMRKIN